MAHPSLTKDGVEGLLHQKVVELEGSVAAVTITKECIVSVGIHRAAANQATRVKRKRLNA